MAEVTWGKPITAVIKFKNTSKSGTLDVQYEWLIVAGFKTIVSVGQTPQSVSAQIEGAKVVAANSEAAITLVWPYGLETYPGKAVDLYVSLYDKNNKEYRTKGLENISVLGSPVTVPAFEIVSITVS